MGLKERFIVWTGVILGVVIWIGLSIFIIHLIIYYSTWFALLLIPFLGFSLALMTSD